MVFFWMMLHRFVEDHTLQYATLLAGGGGGDKIKLAAGVLFVLSITRNGPNWHL